MVTVIQKVITALVTVDQNRLPDARGVVLVVGLCSEFMRMDYEAVNLPKLNKHSAEHK